MKKIAILVCLTLLVSLFAVNVGAYGETVTSTVDFRTLTPADAGDASKASMESLGVTIPEDSGAWWLQDCYHVFATPQDGYKTCSFIQTLEAGEGKVFAADVTLTAGYWLAAVGDPSWFWVEISTDGVNWTEAYADETGRGNEWEASAYAEGTLPLAGTAGASKIYVKFNVERHSGQTAGGITFSTLFADTKDAPAEEPAESKTLSIGDKVITAEGGKWLYNTEVTKETTSGYTMIVFDKNYAGTFETNGYGVALVLDQYGTLVRVYDGANVGFWTAEGKAASAHFNANTYATTAWAELQDGETLIIIPNDGGSNDARKIALSMRGDCGKAAALEGFTFETAPEEPTPTEPQPTEPAPTEPQPTEPSNPENPDTGDIFGIVVALMAVSGTALVVLKKRN